MSALSATAPAAANPSTRLTELAGGARAMAPWLVGLAPFGLVIGISAAHAHIPTLAGWGNGVSILA